MRPGRSVWVRSGSPSLPISSAHLILFLCRLFPEPVCLSNFLCLCYFLPLQLSSILSVSVCLSLCLTPSISISFSFSVSLPVSPCFLLSFFSVPLSVLFFYCSLCCCICLSLLASAFMSHNLRRKDPVTFISHKHPCMENLKTTGHASLKAHPAAKSRKPQRPSLLAACSPELHPRK